jgi:hypothetical protein
MPSPISTTEVKAQIVAKAVKVLAKLPQGEWMEGIELGRRIKLHPSRLGYELAEAVKHKTLETEFRRVPGKDTRRVWYRLHTGANHETTL